MPRQTSVQLTEATERQLEALKTQSYGTTTDIIRVAIDRMWRQETFQDRTPAQTGIQVWQHRTSDERYLVMLDNNVKNAVPIAQRDQDAQIISAMMPDWEWDAELADAIDADADAYRAVWPYESA